MTSPKPGRETYTQRLVLLLLPVVGVIALFGITRLRHPDVPATTSANPEKGIEKDLAEQKSALTEMKKHLIEATEAAEGSNFTKAKGEYSEFKEIWNTVERKSKAQAQERHQQMEEGIDQVNSSLLSATPNQEKVTSDLKFLTQALNSYSSSDFK